MNSHRRGGGGKRYFGQSLLYWVLFLFVGGNYVPRTQQERSISLAGAEAEEDEHEESSSSTFWYGDLSLCCPLVHGLQVDGFVVYHFNVMIGVGYGHFFMLINRSSNIRFLYISLPHVGRQKEPNPRETYKPSSTSFIWLIWPSTPKIWMQ